MSHQWDPDGVMEAGVQEAMGVGMQGAMGVGMGVLPVAVVLLAVEVVAMGGTRGNPGASGCGGDSGHGGLK